MAKHVAEAVRSEKWSTWLVPVSEVEPEAERLLAAAAPRCILVIANAEEWKGLKHRESEKLNRVEVAKTATRSQECLAKLGLAFIREAVTRKARGRRKVGRLYNPQALYGGLAHLRINRRT